MFLKLGSLSENLFDLGAIDGRYKEFFEVRNGGGKIFVAKDTLHFVHVLKDPKLLI